jgi:hypothetical protein
MERPKLAAARCRAARGDSVGAAGALLSPTMVEETYAIFPSTTERAMSPSRAAGNRPNRWRKATVRPGPAWTLYRSSSAATPRADSRNNARLSPIQRRAEATGSAPRPEAT